MIHTVGLFVSCEMALMHEKYSVLSCACFHTHKLKIPIFSAVVQKYIHFYSNYGCKSLFPRTGLSCVLFYTFEDANVASCEESVRAFSHNADSINTLHQYFCPGLELGLSLVFSVV